MESTNQPKIATIYQEAYRQSLHIAAALFIIPLRWLGFRYATAFAAAAFFWNLVAMPKIFPGTLRPEEKQKGYSIGMLAYPICILLLAIFFPVPIVAAGWAVLSFADGLATVFGKLLGKRPLPWNKHKTWVGSFAFFISAALFGWVALEWTKTNNSATILIGMAWGSRLWDQSIFRISSPILMLLSLISALLAALFESLPIDKINDNILAPIIYAISFLLLTIFFPV
jgi:dolichol kinase